jgi:nucleoside-diphosphate-sugar epimerase
VIGGENISYNRLFQMISEISGITHRLFHIPLWTMLTTAGLMKITAGITGRAPLIVPGLVRKFNHNWIVSSDKAIRMLGYSPLSASEGLTRTIEWLANNK